MAGTSQDKPGHDAAGFLFSHCEERRDKAIHTCFAV
jgi:hypothetical protein